MDESISLIHKAGFDVEETQIKQCFVECLMNRVDTVNNLASLSQMSYVEFLVFISRIAH